jgi:glyoxylase-like metal-dependent hydrolase (beta-lactamase superfamily II)
MVKKFSVHVGSLVIAMTALFSAQAPTAFAAAPMAKTQAPGFYRMMLGDFEVTALSDGTVKLPVKDLLLNTSPAKIDAALKRAHLAHPVEMSVNGYVINTGAKLVLIDTGAGVLFGPTLGDMVNNLKLAGYAPEQIDEIYITHLHPDHVGGVTSNGAIVFPNAIVRVDKADADFWLSAEKLNAAAKDAKGFFEGAQASLKPYVAADKLKTFSGNTELIPGIRAVATHGHTAGHNIYVVESKGEKLVLWGDLMHVAAVQFDTPSVTIKFDSETKAAASERAKAYAEAAKNGYLVGSTHIAFPGLGHVRKEASSKGYTWVPLNYSSMR